MLSTRYSRQNSNLNFLDRLSKILLISNCMEFHADERPGMTKLLVAFRNFANAPK